MTPTGTTYFVYELNRLTGWSYDGAGNLQAIPGMNRSFLYQLNRLTTFGESVVSGGSNGTTGNWGHENAGYDAVDQLTERKHHLANGTRVTDRRLRLALRTCYPFPM